MAKKAILVLEDGSVKGDSYLKAGAINKGT
jgi:hypothetical protein